VDMYHFPYRYYKPDAGRWLTRNPLGMVDGPNVYASLVNNPVMQKDLEGTSIVVAVGVGIALALFLVAVLGLGDAGCRADEFTDCISRAKDMIEKARDRLDPQDLEIWNRTTKPGSECMSICKGAAQKFIESLYNPPPVLVP
jgi:hypothetical protein